MIYELKKELEAELASKGVPYRVLYGPERAPATMVDSRIVIERNREQSDTLEAPRARNLNPKMIGVLWQACRCRVYVSSTLAGAGVHEHEREAYALVDKITVALHKCVRKRNNLYRITSAHLLSAADLALEGLEVWSGVVYELLFDVDRAVNDTTWAGAAAATAISGKAATAVTATQDGSANLPSATTEIGTS